jgi:PAS domain S-box-containing protein
LVPLPVRDQVQEIVRRIRAGDMDAHSINENQTKDGRTITCAWFNTPLLDADGRLAAMISLAEDITEQKQADEAMRQLAALVESSDDAIIGKTLDGLIVSWNRGAEKIYGYAAEEVKGRPISLLVPLNRTAEVPHILAELQQGRAIEHYETVRKTKDGTLIHVSLTISPIRNRDGRITGASTIARDITAQRQAEERIRESEALFQQLAANIEGYFWVNAPDDSHMYYMSPGYEKITGRSCARLYERPASWADSIHPEDRARVLALYRGPRRQEARELEYRIVRPDGAVRWIRDRVSPVRDRAGEVYRIAGIGEDITERKQADEKLREYYEHVQTLSHQLLTVQEEERRHLARELHDEIGQVLATINFQFHAAKGLAGASALPRLEECGALLQQAGEQVRSLALELRPTMLDTLGLEATLRWLGERHQQRTGCEVQIVGHLSGAPLAPEMAIACFRVVQEALTNVVRHAAARHFWIELSQSESVLELVVRDDGVGFDVAATQEQAARRGRLGLLGMAERVHLLGGTLQVESEPGRGTRIRASFPSSNVSEQPAEPEE